MGRRAFLADPTPPSGVMLSESDLGPITRLIVVRGKTADYAARHEPRNPLNEDCQSYINVSALRESPQ